MATSAQMRGTILEVVPKGEPHSQWGIIRRGWAFLIFLRWDSFAIGLQNLKHGVAVHLGPVMFGLVKVKGFLKERDALDADIKGSTAVSTAAPSTGRLCAPGYQPKDRFILRFCDTDINDMHFEDEAEAYDAWDRYCGPSGNWNGYLFRLARTPE